MQIEILLIMRRFHNRKSGRVVEKNNEALIPLKSIIVEAKGKAPEQYGEEW